MVAFEIGIVLAACFVFFVAGLHIFFKGSAKPIGRGPKAAGIAFVAIAAALGASVFLRRGVTVHPVFWPLPMVLILPYLAWAFWPWGRVWPLVVLLSIFGASITGTAAWIGGRWLLGNAAAARGWHLHARGDPHAARREYTRAIGYGAGPEIRCNRGIVNQQLGFDDEALADYDAAIAGNSRIAAAHVGRGSVLAKRGQFDEGMAAYNRALAIEPRSADALYGRGWILHTRGDLAGAVTAYSEAIRIKPDYGDALGNRGAALDAQGELEGALADYDRAVPLLPEGAARDGLARRRDALREYLGK